MQRTNNIHKKKRGDNISYTCLPSGYFRRQNRSKPQCFSCMIVSLISSGISQPGCCWFIHLLHHFFVCLVLLSRSVDLIPRLPGLRIGIKATRSRLIESVITMISRLRLNYVYDFLSWKYLPFSLLPSCCESCLINRTIVLDDVSVSCVE